MRDKFRWIQAMQVYNGAARKDEYMHLLVKYRPNKEANKEPLKSSSNVLEELSRNNCYCISSYQISSHAWKERPISISLSFNI